MAVAIPSAEVTASEREQAYMAAWRPFFHAVATSQELDAPRLDEQGRTQPLAVELLGERLIIARLADGLVALGGSCPHRGTELGIGWINDRRDAVVCRYHGAEWCGSGQLSCFPALAVEGRAAPDWRVPSYPVVEQHGLIWVCLEQSPRFPVLDLDEARDLDFVGIPIYAEDWRAGVGRMIEASLDTYHFAFTHVGTLGDPNSPAAPNPDITVENGNLWVCYSLGQPANAGITSADQLDGGMVTVSYEIRATPNVVRLTKSGAAGKFVIYIACTPRGPRLTTWYRVVVRNYDKQVPDDVYIDLENRINQQDQYVVESMEPWQSTTNLGAELQVYMDRPTIAYRRWLGELGMTFM